MTNAAVTTNHLQKVFRYLSEEGLEPLTMSEFQAKYPEYEGQHTSEGEQSDPPPFSEVVRRYNARSEYFDELLMVEHELESNIMAYMLRICEKENAKLIFDAGCGTGLQLALLAKELPSTNFVGYDLSTRMLARCRRRLDKHGLKNVRVQRGNHKDLCKFVARKSVDVIITKCSFDESHSRTPPECNHETCLTQYQAVQERHSHFLKVFSQILRPGGLLLDIGQFMPRSAEAFVQNCDEAGLDLDFSASHSFYPDDKPLRDTLPRPPQDPFVISLCLRKRVG